MSLKELVELLTTPEEDRSGDEEHLLKTIGSASEKFMNVMREDDTVNSSEHSLSESDKK